MEKQLFDRIWTSVEDESKRYMTTFSGVSFRAGSKDEVYDEYERLKEEIKSLYMKDSNGLIDRHKICACHQDVLKCYRAAHAPVLHSWPVRRFVGIQNGKGDKA